MSRFRISGFWIWLVLCFFMAGGSAFAAKARMRGLGTREQSVCITLVRPTGESSSYSEASSVIRGRKLLAALAVASSGDVLYLSAGTFDLGSSNLTIPAGVKLSGAGQAATKITTSSSGSAITFSDGGSCTDLWLDTTSAAGPFVQTTTSGASELFNCKITGILYAINMPNKPQTLKFYNCVIEAYQDVIAQPAGGDSTIEVYLYNCVLRAYYGGGLNVRHRCMTDDHYIEAYNCTMIADSTDGGGPSWAVAGPGPEGVIANCVIRGIGGSTPNDVNLPLSAGGVADALQLVNCVGSNSDGSLSGTYTGVNMAPLQRVTDASDTTFTPGAPTGVSGAVTYNTCGALTIGYIPNDMNVYAKVYAYKAVNGVRVYGPASAESAAVNLVAAGNTNCHITWSWSAPSSGADGYVIVIRTDAAYQSHSSTTCLVVDRVQRTYDGGLSVSGTSYTDKGQSNFTDIPAAQLVTTLASSFKGGGRVGGQRLQAGSNTIAYGSAAPTFGTWAQGDICFNTGAAIGQPVGWMCTVAGTPGTWRALANVP